MDAVPVWRLPPLPEHAWSPGVRAVLAPTIPAVAAMEGAADPGRAPRTKPLNILLVLAHNEHLLGPFLSWAAALAVEGSLDRRDAELLALRAAWNSRSDFEWGHHVEYAHAFGLRADEIARVPDGAAAAAWSPSQRALLRAADELHTGTCVSESTWAELAEHYTPEQLVEVVMTVGQYTMLSMVANTFGVEVEAGLDRLPAR